MVIVEGGVSGKTCTTHLYSVIESVIGCADCTMHVWTYSYLDALFLQLEVEVAQQPEEGGCEVTQTLIACSTFKSEFEYRGFSAAARGGGCEVTQPLIACSGSENKFEYVPGRGVELLPLPTS